MALSSIKIHLYTIVFMKNFLINAVKILASVGILAFLFYMAINTTDANGKNVFNVLMETEKNWTFMLLAFLCCMAAAVITFVRWHLLNRAVGFQVHWLDSVRIGFIGYLVNLAPVGGIVGGDLLKAWILAKEQETIDKNSTGVKVLQSRIPDALATVFTDRLFGLYALFLLAAFAIFFSGIDRTTDNAVIQKICYATYIIAVAWTVLIGIILGPDYTNGKSTEALGRIPYVGPGLKRTVESIRLFQKHIKTLGAVTVLGLAVHFFLAACVFLISASLFGGNSLPLETHLVITPLGLSTGAIPLSVGPFEMVLDIFYSAIPLATGETMLVGSGLVVALTYRIIQLLTSTFGIVYYFSSKQEIQSVMKDSVKENSAKS